MANLEKAKTHLENAMKLKDGAVSWYRERALDTQAKLGEIRLDEHLTMEGKFAKMDELRKKDGTQLLKELNEMNQAYQKELEQAKKHAEKVVFAEADTPDASTSERFESDFKKMKTRLLLDPMASSALKRLDEFIDNIEHQHFAAMVAEDFPDIATSILENASAGREMLLTKKQLANMYDRLESGFITAEQAAAREVLRQSAAMLATSNVLKGNYTVETNASEVFGVDVSRGISDPTTYLAAMAEENE